MNIKPLEHVIREIMSRYNRKPKGWNALADRRGNIIILGPKSNYRLKLVSLGPNKYTGVGGRVKSLERLRRMVEGTPAYGFRPLSKDKIQILFTTLQRKGRLERALVDELLGLTPTSTGEIRKLRPHAVLSGPVITYPDLSAISWRQRKLERKLALEAERLFRKRHPLRAEMYG
ncbi:MAG: hypothetical protein U9O89_02155 [Thermoproteota archaeon]|nr:hypothetical protein [Thermoproteota archaeon]